MKTLRLVIWLFSFTVASIGALRAESRVYMASGLTDEIAQVYVQDLAKKIAAHCDAKVTTHSHLMTIGLAADVARQHVPVVLIGFSLGGNRVVDLARLLAPHRVALLITLDPNRFIGAVPNNVDRAVNIYKEGMDFGGGRPEGARNILIRNQTHIGFASNPQVERLVVGMVCALDRKE